MNKVLITGSRGFIGRELVKSLASQYIVFGTDIKGKGIYLDVTDYEQVKTFLELNKFDKDDVVIHLAALVGGKPSIRNPYKYLYVNTIGTLNLLYAMYVTRIKYLIYLSSWSIFGSNIPLPITEETKLQPENPYGTSKVIGELIVKLFSTLYGIKAIILRPSLIYGPNQEEKNVMQQLLDCIVTGKIFEIYGKGEHTRELIYIDDLVKVIGLCIDYVKTIKDPYEIFILGTEKPYTVNELAMHASRIRPFKVIHKDIKRWAFSQRSLCTKLKQKLGINTKTFIDIEEGLRRCYEWRKKQQ